MKVLSFDVGVRNFAYCAIKDGRISRWEVCDLGSESKEFGATSKALIALLHDLFPEPEWDAILIENQPVMKNPVMKSIQMIVYTYFSIQCYQHGCDCDVKLVSANNKLKVRRAKDAQFETKCSTKYKENKARAIAYARLYLEDQDSRWIDEFERHKKKDDLSDSFLMALHFIENSA